MDTKFLDEIESRRFLLASDVKMNRAFLATGGGELAAICQNLRFPLVLKLLSPKIIHKSDFGAVILDVENCDDAARAYDALLERAAKAGLTGADIAGVSVQEQIGGVEMMLGLKRDPVFGPVLVMGAGGAYVELIDDVVLGICPLSRANIQEMLAALKISRLLDGYRGAPVADREAFVAMALALAAFGMANADWLELDLNPVIVLERGKGALAVDARVITRA